MKVMDIHLQEVAASTFMTDIAPEARASILTAVEVFPLILEDSVRFSESRFPETAWNLLFKKQAAEVTLTGTKGKMG